MLDRARLAVLFACLVASMSVGSDQRLQAAQAPKQPAQAPKQPAQPVPAGNSFRVPYRLTATDHIVVRAKFNGVGPFWFIVDTGAPMLIVSKQVVKRVGVQPAADGWVTFKRMEIEGGPSIEQADAWVEDIYQLRGMTGLGLAGTPLHGVIGYSVLAHYRIELDLERPYMVWTRLKWQPANVRQALGWAQRLSRAGRRGSGPQELETLGSLMQQIGRLFGRDRIEPRRPRGLLGVLLSQQDGKVLVQRVLPGSPAERAGMRPGDRIVRFAGKPVSSIAGLSRIAMQFHAGQSVAIELLRNGKAIQMKAVLASGF